MDQRVFQVRVALGRLSLSANFWRNGLVLFLIAVAPFARAATLGTPAFDPSAGARFNFQPPKDKAHRIDFTMDLRDWYPLNVWPLGTSPRAILDPGATNSPLRFYRAVEVDPVPGIYGFDPDPVPVGATLIITGQFFSATPGANRVTISGVDAKVLAADPQHLTVLVPPGAKSGLVRVTTPAGQASGITDLTVLGQVAVRLAPPAGFGVAGFEAFAAAAGARFTNGVAWLPAPLGRPSVLFASTPATNQPGLLAGIALDGVTNVTLDAQTTAQALVFLNPLAANRDPLVAAQLAGVIIADAKVRALGDLWAKVLLRPGDPLDDPEFTTAYTNAVASVLLTPSLVRAVAERATRVFLQKQATTKGSLYYHEPVATRWLELETKPGKFEVKGFPFNPVDWVVRFQELNVDQALPNGRFDLQAILRQPDPAPTPYPVRGGFDETRTVSADLAASRINFVSYLSKELFKAIAGKGPDDSVQYFRENTIYVMRGVGPAFQEGADRDFNLTYLSSEYGRALAVNIVAALIDALSALIDFKQLDGFARKDLKDWDKFYLKLVDEAAKNGTGIRSAEDFVKAVAKMSQFFFKELVGNLAKALVQPGEDEKIWVDGLVKLSPKIGKLSDGISGLLDNKYLKVSSSIGQVAERASGLVRTTPLETAFVVVGDPFKLDVSASPAVAGLGEDTVITIKGPSGLRAFDTNNAQNQVNFEGPVYFDGLVQGVTGPSGGEQKVTVRIPPDLANTADGNYNVFVNTQGRRGSFTFRVALKTVISGLSPAAGFAATTNFAGSPFAGSQIFIQGVNMNSQDKVFFTGPAEPIPATQIFGATGGLRVNVPAGARTGPIRVDHKNLNGQTVSATSQVFTVLGPPVIQSMTPESGPPGTLLSLAVLNTGNDPNTARIQFSPAVANSVTFGGADLLIAPVPANATSGPVRVFNPAGMAERFFTVTPAPAITNLPTGSSISVGGNSVITLQRAVAFANGEAFPEDDTDYVLADNRRTELDPPYEEGDYVNPDNIGNPKLPRFIMGLNYADAINLGAPAGGAVVMRGNYDTISSDASAPFAGDITLAGLQQRLALTVNGSIKVPGHFASLSGVCNGPVVITGNSNRLNGRYTGPVTVEGDYNILSGEYNGTVTVRGHHNSVGLQTGNIRSNAGPGVVVYGNDNTIAANFRYNTGDCVIVDGGRLNKIDFNSGISNAGNGVVLTGGAANNQVTMRSATTDPVTRQPLRNSGHLGHAVFLSGSAAYNNITGELTGNGQDGILFDGADVHHNTFQGGASLNGRNGVTVANGAHHNTLGFASPGAGTFTPVRCDGNGRNGVAILGGLQTSGGIYASTNEANGLLISGVNETVTDGTYFILLTAPFAADSGNKLAGLRLEKEVHGVHIVNPGYRLKLDGIGMVLDGEGVTGNNLELNITQSVTNGVVVRKAARNLIRLSVSKCTGPGLVVDGAEDNDMRLSELTDNQGPGLLMTGGASGNHLKASAFSIFVSGNATGAVIEKGSHDNILENFGIGKNGDYGAILSGAGTRNNEFISSTFVGATKDGLLIEAGASDNRIGRDAENNANNPRVINARDNLLAGIRITGAGTTGNSVINCLFLPSSTNLQPAGLLVENGAADTLVLHGTFFRNLNGLLVRDGATRVSVVNSRFQSNAVAAIVVSNANSVTIGGPLTTDLNEIFNNPTGVLITGALARDNRVAGNQIHDNTDGVALADGAQGNLLGGDNRIERNVTGIRLEGATRNTVVKNVIQNNQAAGVFLALGATQNRIDDNQVTANTVGIRVTGAGTTRNTITRNSIFGHPGVGAGITLTQGGNNSVLPPRLLEVQANAVIGTTDAPEDSRIELFQDSADEGEIPLGGAPVVAGRFRVPVMIDVNTAGVLFNVTATVTDPDGNTSEFSSLAREDFPPSRLVFSSTRDGNVEIYARGGSAPGGGAGESKDDNLTRNAARDDSPAVASGCDQLLFVSDRGGNVDIYNVPLKPNSNATRLTTDPGRDYDPSWLDPCRKVVFVSERDGNAEIYIMNADGSGQTRLTTNAAMDRSPRGSPDGKHILFVSNRGGAFALWIMNVDGTGQQQLSPAGLVATQSAFSPDGKTIAFVSTRDGNSEIYTIQVDGTGLTRITDDPAEDVEPAWVPGGNLLLFASNRTGNYEVYSVSRSGGHPARLTVTSSDNHTPSAQPR